MANLQFAREPEPINQREREILTLISDGLTNQEIARVLYLSVDTIKCYNQRIFAKLGVANRTQAVKKAREAGLTLSQAALPRTAAPAPRHNLPAAVDSFIDRRDELARLKTYLATWRLVTLTGPGGVGKTRLALQAGWELREVFADGICLVSLAATREASLVVHAIAAALGLNEIPGQDMADRLREALAQQEMLLILDNFEQVLDAGPQMFSLLQADPNLRILVTSRESLHLSGEQVFNLHPLRVAPPSGASLSDGRSQASEAMQLFEQRGQAVQPDFQLTAKNAPLVQEICRRLDGLPLAIELAAARMRIFNPIAILAQLDHRLGLLVGGGRNLPRRQQTMRASIEWSYDLLTPPEQTLFRRLAVFVGGCTLEAAQTVCRGCDLTILEGIESLLDKHLLTSQEINGATRFNMFEILREYALERLEASGEAPAVYRIFAGFYADLVDRVFNQITLLEPEIDNFRAVMRWSIDSGQVEPGLRAAFHSWFWTQWNSEWRFWLESLLNSPGAICSQHMRASGLFHLAFQAMIQGDPVIFQDRLDDYEAQLKELGGPGTQCVVLYLKGYLQILRQDYEGAAAAFSRGLQISEELGIGLWVAFSHSGLGNSLLFAGPYDQAEMHLQTALRRLTDENYLLGRIETLTSLGYLALEKKDLPAARTWFRQSLHEGNALGFKSGFADCLNGLAIIDQQQGNGSQAARLYSAVLALSKTSGLLSHELPLRMIKERYLAALRQAMDPADLEIAWQAGQAMTLEEALQAGLEIEVPA